MPEEDRVSCFKSEHWGNSLVVQWLGLCAFTTVTRV